MEGKTKYYKIADSKKLRAVVQALGIKIENKTGVGIAKDLVEILETEFGKQDGEPLAPVKALASAKRLKI